jgi:hypothetical protein
MSSILPLGDKLNLGRNASAGTNYVSFRDASNFLFVVDTPGSASTITFKEAQSGTGTNNQVLGSSSATVVPFTPPSSGAAPVYWTQTNGVWTSVPIVAGGNYVLSTGVLTLVASTPDMAVVWLNQGALSDTFNFVNASHSAKAITYIASPIDVGRRPTNLRNIYS